MLPTTDQSPAGKNWQTTLEADLSNREAANLLRTLRPAHGIDFASNDYLALNRSGLLQKILREEVQKLNDSDHIGSTASRLVRGHYSIYDHVEKQMADLVQQPAALLFHSGYAANLGCMQALFNARDFIFADRLSHASLLDGIRLSGARRHYFKHNDLNDLEDKLKRYKPRGRAWIVTEAVFSMDGDCPNLEGLVMLAEKYNALIYLDEAHSFGLLGPRGAGLASRENLCARIDVHVFPCGKAPGLMGAFVCGTGQLKSFLINNARSLIYSTAQPPVLVAMLGRVLELFISDEYAEIRNKLQNRASQVRGAIQSMGYDTAASTTQIIPVILGSAKRALEVQKMALENGLDVRAIRPPTVPEGTSRLRLCLQSAHKDEEIEKLIEILCNVA